MQTLLIGLSIIALVSLNSCATTNPTKRIANEWCDCMDSDSDGASLSKKCDSVAEKNLESLVAKKWQEVVEKKLPIDSMQAFKLSLHMEYWKMTEKCR